MSRYSCPTFMQMTDIGACVMRKHRRMTGKRSVVHATTGQLRQVMSYVSRPEGQEGGLSPGHNPYTYSSFVWQHFEILEEDCKCQLHKAKLIKDQ